MLLVSNYVQTEVWHKSKNSSIKPLFNFANEEDALAATLQLFGGGDWDEDYE
jgi:hypothetical protein